MAAESERHRALCPVIAGPTAVGKTSLVIALAAAYPVEVISLDSRQIYRGLRIGTAQPSPAEQAVCRHHLIDFLAPGEAYTAQRFREDFCRVWREVTARGHLPILAGGAGMYLRAVTGGLLPLPAGSDARLPRVRDEVAALDDAVLAAELARVDPASHARLHANDRYRRARALEIYRLAGKPLSELAAGQEPDPALGLDFPLFVLERPVAELDARIEARTQAMLAAGWVEETRALLQDHPADSPGLRSIGYAEIVRFLAGELRGPELAPAIVQATRQYAKRQRTWFRPLERVAAGGPDDRALRRKLQAVVERALAER